MCGKVKSNDFGTKRSVFSIKNGIITGRLFSPFHRDYSFPTLRKTVTLSPFFKECNKGNLRIAKATYEEALAAFTLSPTAWTFSRVRSTCIRRWEGYSIGAVGVVYR